jgi:hypothetical protein
MPCATIAHRQSCRCRDAGFPSWLSLPSHPDRRATFRRSSDSLVPIGHQRQVNLFQDLTLLSRFIIQRAGISLVWPRSVAMRQHMPRATSSPASKGCQPNRRRYDQCRRSLVLARAGRLRSAAKGWDWGMTQLITNPHHGAVAAYPRVLCNSFRNSRVQWSISIAARLDPSVSRMRV